jgi:hypothetical protein
MAAVLVHARTLSGETGHNSVPEQLRDPASRFVFMKLRSRPFGSRIAHLST